MSHIPVKFKNTNKINSLMKISSNQFDTQYFVLSDFVYFPLIPLLKNITMKT